MAMLAQRQEQPQSAFVHIAESLREQSNSQFAMSRLTSPRDPLAAAKFSLAVGALSLMVLYGIGLQLRSQLRTARALRR
jgi:hypothetical protein